MTLCVTSKQSINDLEKMVLAKFKGIKDKKYQIPEYGKPPPYGKNNSGYMIKMVPVKDVNELKIVWNLPYYGNEINKIHLKYFIDLFGHEGENSILSYLKDKGWATYLQICKHSIGFCLTKFEINIELTQAGLDNYVQVVATVFQYA